MKPALNLTGIGRGFADVALGSQSVFRRALHALSQPGSLVDLSSDADIAPPLHAAAGALLQALLDPDTRLWLTPSVAVAAVADYLRFHTGCVLVEAPTAADFALIGSVEELPALSEFAIGTELYPERSTTVVLQLPWLTSDAGWRLAGPGIADRATLTAGGLGADFVAQWTALQRVFPCGIDLFLTSGKQLAGLPRTTRIEV